MKKLLLHLSLFILTFCVNKPLFAQCINGLSPNGSPCGGIIQTAVPFLRIVPDARSGAMGDVGIALTPDANSILYNASKLALADKKWGVAVNVTPWLRNLVPNLLLLHEAGYYQFGEKKKQAIGFGLHYFSYGKIDITDFNGIPMGTIKPYEMAFTGSYSKQLSENWAIGLASKFIYSDLVNGFSQTTTTPTQRIFPGRAIALDISTTYKKTMSISGIETNLILGAAMSNLGNKITYVRQSNFLPANLGIGSAWEVNFNKNNKLLVSLEFNKLLVPTPQPLNTVLDLKNIGVIEGAWRSFSDAPGGFKEEMQEINISIGLEYWLQKHVAIRGGYFHENINKGGRRYYTLGGGLRLGVVGINISYLKALPYDDYFNSSLQPPLNGTWRFSLLLNGVAFKK
jgi:hypothetical protein